MKMEKKKDFFCQIENFLSEIGKKNTYFLALGMGPNFGSKIVQIESPEFFSNVRMGLPGVNQY